MIDAIWSIADKVIWVNLEALPRIKYCVGLQPKEMRVGRQMQGHLQSDITQKTSH